MKTKKFNKGTGQMGVAFCALTLFVIAALVAPQMAQANTAANTTIRNTVTVNYDDTAGTAQTAVTALVDITVNLVEATATLSAPGNQSTDPATDAVYNYTLTSNANGPDIYLLTEELLTESGGIAGSTSALSVASLDLGATTVAAAGSIAAVGTTDITVPSDLASDAVVNGIGNPDTVVINGEVFTVASVTDNGGSPGTSTITVNGNGTITAIAIGDLIGERGSFDLTVTPGTVSATTNQTITITIGAEDDAGAAAQATDETVTTVTVPTLAVKKYVANVTTPVVGGGDILNKGGTTYYTSGVTGNPGETLEYVIEIANSAGAGTATDVVISDPIPPFTTYVATSMQLDPDDTGFAAVTDADSDGDGGETDTSTIYIYAGAGGNDGAAGVGNGTGGSLPATTTTYGLFQVTID